MTETDLKLAKRRLQSVEKSEKMVEKMATTLPRAMSAPYLKKKEEEEDEEDGRDGEDGMKEKKKKKKEKKEVLLKR